MPIGDRFAQQARNHPDKIALYGEDGEFTYGELNARSDRLARHLQDLGVTLSDVVAVDGRRRAATVVGLLAILKAGAAYLALDNRYPAQRRQAILRDAGARFLLVNEDQDMVLPPECTAVPLDGQWPDLLPTACGVTSAHIAYLAYTSGSTGDPKGVCVPHRAVSRLVIDADFLPIAPDDVFLQFASMAFDASTLEIWGPLLNGVRLVMAPSRELSINELTKLVSHHGVTVLWLTAGLFQQVTEIGLDNLHDLRYLLAGGDVLSPPHVNRAINALPGTTLINGYGPTENTTFTCCHPVTEQLAGPVPIGRPIRGTGIYLLDADLNPVADGEIGELYTAGEGLAHGYLGSPALTAEKFLPNPFGGIPGDRMYRTGDLVRRLPDGSLDYHGRTDHQVKSRGFRIELGEVESAIASLTDIAEAAVVQQPQTSGGKGLVAYVVGRTGPQLSILHIRRQLVETLPSYAIPALIRIAESLPLTSNGKVDRGALAVNESQQRPELSVEYREPGTLLETAVAQLWTDHLGVTGIGADDDFFELGGHSLVGVRITADLQREYGVEVSPITFYLDPTPAGLAAAIEKEQQAK